MDTFVTKVDAIIIKTFYQKPWPLHTSESGM